MIPTLKVTEDLIIHNVKYSDIITDYNVIPLETTNESLIGNIDKIVFHDNQFFILDQFKVRTIFVFSSTGKFMWKLSKFGKGPGEFIEPTDFCIAGVNSFSSDFLLPSSDTNLYETKRLFNRVQ